MIRLAGSAPLAVILLAGFTVALAEPPSGLSNWAFDEITLKNGNQLQGLVLSETPDGILFRSVSRPPGRPTVTMTTTISKSELAAVKRMSDEDRKLLTQRLAELDPRGEGERLRMDSLEIVAIKWLGNPTGGKRFDSEYFVLESSGSEELTRRSAVRLEQIYIAFVRFLPPTVKTSEPSAADAGERTKIQLATDKDEYRLLLGSIGEKQLLNSAVFDPRSNRIMCWNDLKRLGSELQTARLYHSQQLASLKQYEEQIAKLYKKDELERYMASTRLERNRVWEADVANGKKFDQATARLFAVLYHEAFHAYVGTFVYPPLRPEDVKAGKGTGELPRWLNEGLAQVFETAVVEAGELRADSPDRDRLMRVKDWLRGRNNADHLLPLNDLLTTNMDAFLAFHADQKAASNRAYLTSWALAYYLTFDRHVIGTADFKKYLIAVNSGTDSRQAFATLVGKDLAAFEKDWHDYLNRLQSDGTLRK